MESPQKKCKFCQELIDAKATKCPKCSSDLRSWFSRHPIWTVLIALLVIPSCISTMMRSESTDSSKTPQTPAATVQPTQPSAAPNTNAAAAAPAPAPAPAAKPPAEAPLVGLTITSSKIVNNAIGTPEWHLVVKNSGTKDVDAYTVAGELYDNFDNPVGTFNSSGDNTFSGLSQDLLKAGASEEISFNLAVHDHTTKVKNPRIVRIHFTDGTSTGN